MKMAIGCDHTAVELKNVVVDHLQKKGIEVIDHGAYTSERTDYPLYAKAVSESIQNKDVDLGILICGTGIGMSMAANKFKGIRAAAVSDVFSAKATREHNDANILCFGSRVVGPGLATLLVDAYLDTQYEGGRHQRRIDLIDDYEKKSFE